MTQLEAKHQPSKQKLPAINPPSAPASPLKIINRTSLLLLFYVVTIFFSPILSGLPWTWGPTWLGPAPAWAQPASQDTSKEPKLPAEIKHLVADSVKGVDKAHEELSHTIAKTAAWFDSFFDTQRHAEESNATRLRLKFVTLFERGERPTVTFHPDLKLVLPHFNRKFALVFTGDPDSEADVDASPTQALREQFADANQRNLAAALQYHVFKSVRHSVIVIGGLRFRDSGSVALFVGPRYRYYKPFKVWAFRFTQRAYGFSDAGWELISTVDLERVVSPKLFFRSTTEGTLFDDDKGYYYDQTFQLFHSLSSRSMIVYEWNSYLVTNKPDQLREMDFQLRYRRQIWRDWIVVEVAPLVAFSDDDNYKANPGVIFRLELSFGMASTRLKETGK